MQPFNTRHVSGLGKGLFVILLSANFAAQAGGVNVTQHHNDSARSGLFVEPAFTVSAVSNLTRDLSFNGSVAGSVFAQPLYIENGPGGKAMIVVVTESNNVCALNAIGGGVIWQTNVGPPAPEFSLLCTDIYPLGITGTPVVDLDARVVFRCDDDAGFRRHIATQDFFIERGHGGAQSGMAGRCDDQRQVGQPGV